MKPFKINRNSWHYKLNKNFLNDSEYWMEDRWEPKHNNFCAYWRATMFRLIGAGLMAFGCSFVLAMLGMVIYQNPMESFLTVVATIAVLLGAFGIAAFGTWMELRAEARRKVEEEVPTSLFAAKYKAYKSKVCPGVEYND